MSLTKISLITLVSVSAFVLETHAGCFQSRMRREEAHQATELDEATASKTAQIRFEKARSALIDKRLTFLADTYFRSFASSTASFKAFVSYAWPKRPEEEGVQRFLLTLVEHLGRAKIRTVMDLLELTPGAPLEAFMKTGIDESQAVLVIGTPTYYERSFQETTPVKFEFDHLLKTPQKAIPLLYTGDLTPPFQGQLTAHRIAPPFDMREDRASYYLQLPAIIRHIYEQAGLWTELLGRSTDNYLHMCREALKAITPEVVTDRMEALEREALDTEQMLQMQINLLAQNMPVDERFAPSNWHIPRPAGTFVERAHSLEVLTRALELQNPVFLHGEEGTGKKQLALALAQEAFVKGVRKYTFGAVVPGGDLSHLQHQLKLSTPDEMRAYLSTQRYFLICPDVVDERLLPSLLELPPGAVVMTSSRLTPNPKRMTPIMVAGLTPEESVDLLTSASGVEEEDAWRAVAEKLHHHPGQLERVAGYARDNTLVDPKDLPQYLRDPVFKALLARRQETSPEDQQRLVRKMRRGTYGTIKRKTQDVPLKERVLAHLLEPEVKEFCQAVQRLKLGGEDKILWITSPWDPRQSTLLFMERMDQDLKACGFRVKYRLDETNTRNPAVFDVMAAQEAQHALLVGTSALATPEAQALGPLLKRFYDTGTLVPLSLEGGMGLFLRDYQKLLIEDISTSPKYARSLARLVEQILNLKDSVHFKEVCQPYLRRVEEIERGLNDDVIRQHGREVKAQDATRDWHQWMDIKRRAHLLGYEVPPEVWHIEEPEMTIGRSDVLGRLLQKLGPMFQSLLRGKRKLI